MDDRELLKLAAKAAGIELRWHECAVDADGTPDFMDSTWCFIPSAKPPHNRRAGDAQAGTIWNPLTDDGDALRLLARLRLVLNVSDGSAHAWKWNPGSMEPFSVHRGDEMAAVRRAIVQEAATLAPKS
jgi:hypothetical protein